MITPIEKAIFEILPRQGGDWQSSDLKWRDEVRGFVPDCSRDDVLETLKSLWRLGLVRLTKADASKRHSFDYSANVDDEAFFCKGFFNVVTTESGTSFWNWCEAHSATR